MADIDAALEMYGAASEYVTSAGLLDEVAWQREADFNLFTETDLLREAAWVILCSGFREASVRRIFDYITLCFCEWESAEAIVDTYPACGFAALSSFKSGPKISAIFEVALRVHTNGFASTKASILRNPIESLRSFPFIGPITVWHLAKNLGLDVVKPDRHLMRISAQLGFLDPHEFCTAIAHNTGHSLRVVDLVIWRYLADNSRSFFTEPDSYLP